jgi:hypothetical protein
MPLTKRAADLDATSLSHHELLAPKAARVARADSDAPAPVTAPGAPASAPAPSAVDEVKRETAALLHKLRDLNRGAAEKLDAGASQVELHNEALLAQRVEICALRNDMACMNLPAFQQQLQEARDAVARCAQASAEALAELAAAGAESGAHAQQV